jgi:hypothetical protein
MTSQAPKMTNLVSTKETDYLDEDPAIRNQNYVCLSFLSPEDTLKNKEVWIFERYMSAVGNEIKTMLDTLSAKYPEEKGIFSTLLENYNYLYTPSLMQEHYQFFKQFHGEKLEKEFHEVNNFQTSVRGIKVRGVYDTLKEAQNRAEYLKKHGDRFDIFIGQVGVWCPWSPNPNDIQDQEYTETQLNTIMKQYKENADVKDVAFEQRKQQKIASVNVRPEAVENTVLMDTEDVPTYSQKGSQENA